MNQNDDFAARVVLHSADLPWIDSPMKGVKRRMLDRVGGEVARATTMVSYAPGSHFSAHEHTGGEEFIVLEGVFQDEHGDFPVGSYIRNPPQSSHTPGSEPGCVIFVKLWQFDLDDRTAVRTDMAKTGLVADAARDGVSVGTLFADDREQVRIEQWAAGSQVTIDTSGGAEVLVMDGEFAESSDKLTQHSWMRVPAGGTFNATAGAQGCKVWVKTGHLRFAEEERLRLPA